MKVALKPYLLYVPSKAGRPHFRGGDDLIIPVEHINDPGLLDQLMVILGGQSDGMTRDMIQAHVEPGTDLPSLDHLIDHLLQAGILWMPPESGPRDFLWNYLSRFAVNMEPLEKQIASLQITFQSFLDETLTKPFKDALRMCGLSVQSADERSDMVIVLCDFGHEHELDQINQDMMASGKTWMLVRLAGPAQLQLGPVFIPGQTACFACLRRRMDANRTYFDMYEEFKQHETPSLPGSWHSLHTGLAGQAVAFEALIFLLGLESSGLVGRMRNVNLFEGLHDEDTLLKLPDCLLCGGHHGR
jgi:bacteriocin biosynthesis cyclodehydratase domain-containing protein